MRKVWIRKIDLALVKLGHVSAADVALCYDVNRSTVWRKQKALSEDVAKSLLPDDLVARYRYMIRTQVALKRLRSDLKGARALTKNIRALRKACKSGQDISVFGGDFSWRS